MSRAANRLRFAVVLAMAATLASAAAPVAAGSTAGTTLRIEAPELITQGEETAIVAVLRDRRGRPIPGATIVFSERISFFSSSGVAPIGEARTDFQGRASLRYVPTASGDGQLIAEFHGGDTFAPASAALAIGVAAGAVPATGLTAAPAEVLLPRGVTAIWFVVLLVGVWAAIATAVYNVVRIPGERRRSALAAGPGPSPPPRFGIDSDDPLPAARGAPPSGA